MCGEEGADTWGVDRLALIIRGWERRKGVIMGGRGSRCVECMGGRGRIRGRGVGVRGVLGWGLIVRGEITQKLGGQRRVTGNLPFSSPSVRGEKSVG